MKLQPIESKERLYVRVARRISEYLQSGDISPGDKLPSERDLAEMLKVSRPSVREAMIALEISGAIEVRTGSGIYVAQRAKPEGLELTDSGAGPFEILEMRLIVEPEACALAALRISAEQLQNLEKLYAEMIAANATSRMEDVDRQFHIQIAQGAENVVIASSVEWLWNLRSQSDMSRGFHRLIIEEGVYPVLDEHQAIMMALKSRDADASRLAMRSHLEAAIEAAARHLESS